MAERRGYLQRRRDRKSPEVYRDMSGSERSVSKSLRKTILNTVLVLVVTYWAWASPFGIVLPFGWPPYLVGGMAMVAIQGNTNFVRLLLKYFSTFGFWPTGRAPLHKLDPVTAPFWPERSYADKYHCWIQVDAKLRYYYPYVWCEVNGINYGINWPGNDFVCIPLIEIRQNVLDWKSGKLAPRSVNYSKMPAGPDGVFFNGDTTRAEQHVEIPPFMLDALRPVKGFRPDVSIGGRFRGEDASRVDFALHPAWDFWAMKSIEWPAEFKEAAKLEARRENLAVKIADDSMARLERVSREQRQPGAPSPPLPHPGPAPAKDWGEQ